MRARLLFAFVVLAAGALASVTLSLGPASAAGASPALVRGSAAPAPANCPPRTAAGATCVTIPANCPKSKRCPEVVATPTAHLASEQAVYLTMSNFRNDSDSLYISYCQDVHPLTGPPPMCVSQSINELPDPQVVVKPFPNGTSSYAFQVLYLPGGSTPFTGAVPGEDKHGNFFCDAADPCSVDVTDPYLGPHGSSSATRPDPDNTAVIPVHFAAEEKGCPRATFIDTESEFGINSLLASTASTTCDGSHPVADDNVDVDAPSAVSAFAQGSMPVVFTDSPLAATEQQTLGSMKGQYAFIPIALSANVIGFQAIQQGQQGYPDDSFSLTPTMTAGIVTDYYSNWYGSDPAKCAWIKSDPSCYLVYQLNQAADFESPQEYGSYVRGDASTPTYAVFNWICNAPHLPVKDGKHVAIEQYTASQVLDAAYQTNVKPVPKSCPANLDIFPAFTRDTPNFGTASTPQTQLTKVQGFVGLPQNSTQTPHAGFAPMSWPDAFASGLYDAALQNGAGNFVAPTDFSVEAAADLMRPDAQGVYQPDYTSKNPGAYPMPDVWYALVSTHVQSSTQVTADRALIDDLLEVSGGPDVSKLPVGYAPLPKRMYEAALADVTKDITDTAPKTTTTTLPPVTTLPTPPSPPPTTVPSSQQHTTTSTPTKSGSTTNSTVPKKPTTVSKVLPTQLASVTLFGHDDSWLPVLFACLLAVAAVFGPALLALSRRRKASSHGKS